MRIAIVSDIHGNLTAFEAVLKDLKETSPDLVLHAGDLADSGSSPVEIVDRIRDLGWPGVAGNTDEMLFRPESLGEFAAEPFKPGTLFGGIDEMAAYTRDALGEERLAWLRDLPRAHIDRAFALVHAAPESLWRAPAVNASDTDLETAFGSLQCDVAIYGHIHHPFARQCSRMLVVNTGSVSLSLDGDRRASYLLIDLSATGLSGSGIERHEIRRIEYDIAKEKRALAASGLPYADWTGRMIEAGRFIMP